MEADANDILDSLEDLGYQGSFMESSLFDKGVNEGPTNVEFCKVVEWITGQLAAFHGIDDKVSAIKDAGEAETFQMELSGFLREYGCPYESLTEGPISGRLSTRRARLTLLRFLLSELEATRIIAVNKPHLLRKKMDVQPSGESELAAHMKNMLIALGFPKPPDGITPFQLFSKIESKIKQLVGEVYPAHLSKPLLKARLSDKQWKEVEFINDALRNEYETRRDMMLKRLDVTIQSFRWSDRAKQRDDQLAAVYQPIRRQLLSTVVTDIPHLLAAREDLLNIEKTSSGKSREKTRCDLNRVLIGRVPDRGGRAFEHEPPPPEMPAFMQRQQGPQGGGRGGGQPQRHPLTQPPQPAVSYSDATSRRKCEPRTQYECVNCEFYV